MSFLDRSHSIAPHDYNRWLRAACRVGSAFVYWANLRLFRVQRTFNQTHRYHTIRAPMTGKLTTVGWVFSIALAVLGASAALFGTWMERVGPRKAMFVAACCFGLGFLVAALGVSSHNIWLIYLGNGVIGGVGLGLGYIGPVSTLMKWFPDKPGMATGLAIMGFGGGAMFASPLSVWLMNAFSSPTSVGVAPTFVALGLLYSR